MVAGAGLRIPTTVGEAVKAAGPPGGSSFSTTESSSESSSPQLARRRRGHRTEPGSKLPKFSISLEEAEAVSFLRGVQELSVSGPASLPSALGPLPSLPGPSSRLALQPDPPSPLVRSSPPAAPSRIVKSSSATGLSLLIPPPGDPSGAEGGAGARAVQVPGETRRQR
jgi:hypothetical protein